MLYECPDAQRADVPSIEEVVSAATIESMLEEVTQNVLDDLLNATELFVEESLQRLSFVQLRDLEVEACTLVFHETHDIRCEVHFTSHVSLTCTMQRTIGFKIRDTCVYLSMNMSALGTFLSPR